MSYAVRMSNRNIFSLYKNIRFNIQSTQCVGSDLIGCRLLGRQPSSQSQTTNLLYIDAKIGMNTLITSAGLYDLSFFSR